MDKSFSNSSLAHAGAINFQNLVIWWSEKLGQHHVPLREHANEIHDLLAPDAVHHELVQRIVREVYCANRCGSLNALVTMEDTFTALGRVGESLLASQHADIDQISFLESLGWHTRQFFDLHLNLGDTLSAPHDIEDQPFPTTGVQASY